MITKTTIKKTTVSVSIADNQRLTEYCDNYSIAKKDFISTILNYLESNGINAKIHNAPKTELEKIIKRIDQLFAFYKTQEKTFLRPALNSIISSDLLIKSNINSLIKKDDLSVFSTSKTDIEIAKHISGLNEKMIDNVLGKLNQMDTDFKRFQNETQKELQLIKNKRGITL